MNEYILLYNISVSVTFKLCVYLHLAFLFVMLSENQVYDNVLSYTVLVNIPDSTKLVPNKFQVLTWIFKL